MKSPAELAYEAAFKARDVHERMLESLRARTGSVIAAASISASFLGSAALGQQGASYLSLIFSYTGIVAFAGSIVTAALVLLPRTNQWPLEPSAERVLKAFVDSPEQTPETTLAQLAVAMEKQSEDMKERMVPLWKQFRWSVILLGVQIVLWLVALGLEAGD